MEYSTTRAGGVETVLHHHQRHKSQNRIAQLILNNTCNANNSSSISSSSSSNMYSPTRSPSSSHQHHQHQRRDHYQRQREQFQHQLQQLIHNSHVQCKTESPRQQYVSCIFSPSRPSSSPSSVSSPLSQSSPMTSSPASTGSASPMYLANRQMMVMKESELASPSASPGVAYLPSPNKALASHCKRRLDFNHNVPDDSTSTSSNLNFRLSNLSQSINHSNPSMSPSFNHHHHFNHPQSHHHQQSQHHDLNQHQLQDVNMNEVVQVREVSQDMAALGRVPAVAVARRNERERNRVKLINMTFHTLREHLPQSLHKSGTAKNKKMSKVETLRAAIDYIRQLHTLIKDRQAAGALAGSEDTENIHAEAFPRMKMETVLTVDGLDVDMAGDSLSAAKAAVAGHQASSTVSPLSSAGGGGQSPLSDDCCSSYDQLSAEEEDLLEFASWF
nr:hypothetical protein BaRGS_013908 [Batillaria attramentaria]